LGLFISASYSCCDTETTSQVYAMSAPQCLICLAAVGVGLAAQAPHRAAINAVGMLTQDVDLGEDTDSLAAWLVSDPLTAPLESFMEVPAEHLEIMHLEKQLAASKAAVAVLDTERESLRQELEGWKTSGAKVLEREHSLLEHVQRAAPSSSLAGGHAPLLHALPLVLFFALLSAAAALAMRGAEWPMSMMAPSKQAAAQVTKPFLRRLGVGAYTVDVSELQVYVPGAPASSEVCVKLRLGDGGKGLRSKPGESLAESPALAVRSGFHVTVKASDGPCIFSVIDRNKSSTNGIANFGRLELSAGELVRMARCASGQEFYRFALSSAVTPPPASESLLSTEAKKSAADDVSVEAPVQPYIAMRIKDVTGKAQAASTTGARSGAVLMYSC